MNTKGIIFSGNITGPGKTTVCLKTIERFKDRLVRVVSYATRAPREYEVNGVDYNFTDDATFLRLRDNGKLYEYTDAIPGRFYGVPREPIEEAFAEGKIPCFVTDFRGIENLAEVADEVLRFWVTAPYEQLVRRIQARETDPAEIEKRVKALQADYAWFRDERPSDLVVVPNLDDQLERAVTQSCATVDKFLFVAA